MQASGLRVDGCCPEFGEHQVQGVSVGLEAVLALGAAGSVGIGVAGFAEVNYLEHYGLLRQHTTNGCYERCTPEHSWNSDHLVTNLFLYHLQRHSDHHANPTRRYQILRSMHGAPNLPSGYASMIALTYVPAVWRKVMDHRVLEHYDGDITWVNIHPRMRDKVLARYGAAGVAQ